MLKPQPREQHRNAWISEETWRLVDKRVTMRRKSRARTGLRKLGRAIQASMKGDRKRRVGEAGTAVESMLQEDSPNARGAWRRMKGWYRAAAKRGPPPAQAPLERITAEQTELYRRVPPPGENIPVNVDPTHIDDSVPTEDEVVEAVKKLRRNRSGGPLGIRAEHVKGWLAAARRGGMAEEQGETKTATEEEGEDLWGKVVELTQTAFREGNLAEEAMWQTVVMIPKGKWEFRGIGLVEVIWKLLTLILHRRLAVIKLHDILHGFLTCPRHYMPWSGQGRSRTVLPPSWL